MRIYWDKNGHNLPEQQQLTVCRIPYTKRFRKIYPAVDPMMSAATPCVQGYSALTLI